MEKCAQNAEPCIYRHDFAGESGMNFADFVCFEASVPKLKASERNAVITELVDALQKAGRIKKGDKEKITRAIIRRENEASTGLGKGVAIPHVKHAAVKKPVAAVGLNAQGIDFRALDKQPVYSVILLISPADDPQSHLKAMECIFGHLQNEKFRSFLRQSDTSEKIEDLLREADQDPTL